MPASNFTQYSFLGGEISPWAMGRTELPTYRQSMKLSFNGLPVEEGAWTRRPGFADCGYTHKGLPGIVRSFIAGDITTNGINEMVLFELTSDDAHSWLRFWVPGDFDYPALLCHDVVGTVTSFSGASPTLMTMSAAQDWVDGDTIFIKVHSGAGDNGAQVNGRQFIVNQISTTTFELSDAATGVAINGGALGSYTGGSATAQKIVVEDLPYTSIAETRLVRVLQSGIAVLLLSKTKSPWLVTLDNKFKVLSKDADFKDVDGPYLDPELGSSQTGNKPATVSTTDGHVYQVAIGGSGGHLFTANDIGRAFRMWSQPAAYNPASSPYASGDMVTYSGVFYISLADSNTTIPGSPAWSLNQTLGRWSPGYITAVTDATHIEFTQGLPYDPYIILGNVIDTWALGKYGPGQYPACGGWLDGRLLLGGALPNNVDASGPNLFDGIVDYYRLFAPSDIFGGVYDDAAANEVFNDKDSNQILWFSADRQGMIFATEDGQWLFGAQTSGESLTPTTGTVRKVSRFKAAFIEPIRIGTALIFVQTTGVKIYEYMVDAFSNRFTGRLLNANAQHLPEQHGGVIDLAYQEDPVPCVWTACADGTLLGCTYRRFSDFATVPPEFNGWHQHTHGGGRKFASIAITSIANGQDALAGTTCDPVQGKYHVEVMTRIWGPE